MKQRRGFTLIEMLVVLGVSVVVIGLTLGIADESQRATQHILHQQGALQYCQAAIDESVRTLQGAVAVGDLPQPGLASQLQFKADQVTIASYSAGTSPGLRLVTLGNHDNAAGTGQVPLKGMQRLAIGAGQSEAEINADLVKVAPQGFTAKIRFGYAGPTEPGKQVVYAESWTGPELPSLIRVTAEAALQDNDTTRSLVLQTAVIPGLLAGGGGAK